MKVLFVAYQEASNPIMKYSQGFPYINGLEKKGVKFFLMTYENSDSIRESENFIKTENSQISWTYEIYNKHSGIIATIIDIIKGIYTVFLILLKNDISVIHARSTIAALISFIPAKFFRVKIFFDTRGLLTEKYTAGGFIKKKGLIYKLMKKGEYFLLNRVDYFTVETYSHARLLKRYDKRLADKMDVIPCCVDTNKFKIYPDNGFKKEYGLENRFIIVYLGKTGTWHLLDNMFDFFLVVKRKIDNALFLFLTQDNPSEILNKSSEKGIDSESIKIIKPLNKEIPCFLSSANAGIFFISPYKGYNSTHIKYSEYLLCGLVVVTNKGIGDTDYINKKERVGITVMSLSPCGYEKAVDEFKKLIENSHDIKQRCMEVGEKYFSLEKGIEKYWKIYRRLGKYQG